MIEHKLKLALVRIENDHFKLILLCGSFKTGKTTIMKKMSSQDGYYYMNLNLLLTENLLLQREESYSVKSQDIIKEIFDNTSYPITLVDNIELLFSNEIGKLNPVDVFKNIARDRVIILALPCKVKGNKAEYSVIGRNDHMIMDISGLTVIRMEGESHG